MSKESIARSDELFHQKLIEMIFSEIRCSRGMSQEKLAKKLQIKQPNIDKLEKRADIYISTLRSAIEAMGGTLDIVAHFPDVSVKITNFSSTGEDDIPESRDTKDKKERIPLGHLIFRNLKLTNSTQKSGWDHHH